MIMEVLAPYITWLKTSLPRSSVPKGFIGDGGLNVLLASILYGSYGAIWVGIVAIIMIAIVNVRENSPSGSLARYWIGSPKCFIAMLVIDEIDPPLLNSLHLGDI
jgi:hypothetical protein